MGLRCICRNNYIHQLMQSEDVDRVPPRIEPTNACRCVAAATRWQVAAGNPSKCALFYVTKKSLKDPALFGYLCLSVSADSKLTRCAD